MEAEILRRLRLIVLVLLIIAGGLSAGCGSRADRVGEHGMAMAPLEEMPGEVQQAMVPARQAYQYTAANPDVFREIPCYCGCATQGHTSNYDCYVASANGGIQFDSHALACEICVDITQDTVRLISQGKGIPEIKTYLEATYARYGPSTGP